MAQSDLLDAAFTAVGAALKSTNAAVATLQAAEITEEISYASAFQNAYASSVTEPTTVETVTLASDTFTGANGSAPNPALWTASPTTVVESGSMVINTPATAYAVGLFAFLSGTALVADSEVTFDMTLASLAEQYPVLGIRVQDDSIWPSGGGSGEAESGYSINFNITENTIAIQAGPTAGNDLDSFPYVFTLASSLRVNVTQKALKIRIWPKGQAEPTAWTYSSPTIVSEQSGGSIIFIQNNGAEAAANPLTIGNIVVTTPVLTLGQTTTAPTTNPAGFDLVFSEDFNIDAAAGGPFASVYADSWQPYIEGTGNEYYPNAIISAHDGVMDVAMNGTQGAAGSFGPASIAFSHQGGKFTVRAKALDAIGNGAAFMLWPNDDNWDEGEIDYPESNFEATPFVHQHVMNNGGQDAASQDYDTGASWRDWHTFSIEWLPGTSVKYFLDDVLVFSTTTNVPTSAHRHMFQVGNHGAPGHLYIDWVAHYAIAS